MNTRHFIKSLVSCVVGLPLLTKAIRPKFAFKEKMPPFERRICFKNGNLFYEFFVTDNILIPHEDGSYSCNVYGELCKVVGRAYSGTTPLDRWVRLEGNFLNKDVIEKHWEHEVQSLVRLCEKHFDKKATCFTMLSNKCTLQNISLS